MTHTFKTFPKLALTVAGAVALFLASCSKNNDIVEPQSAAKLAGGGVTTFAVIADGDSAAIVGPGVTSGTIYRAGNVYTIKNFKQAYSTGAGQPVDGNFYWRFTDNEAGSPANFNIKFTGVATGDITVGGSDDIRYVDKAFSAVTSADWATASVPVSKTIGMNTVTGTGIPPSVSALANGKGWYVYGWSSGHTVTPVSGRVLLYQNAASGTIYAFDIQSIYLNGVTGGSFPYYNFRSKAL
ncbi:hypothetical protein LX64_01784 [Chitinophaga skermanii]|uniref:Heme-binding HmuY-like protein n=1 Tax=Chitinophaga skermanii TaxID=331697 RepID=A0A327QYA3_9BACT|nr:hypothetical protein [Chitinophaga skermanii]RAJ06657.1 hypothetical protein LX64_01784 [Chitinophaga skermanii]